MQTKHLCVLIHIWTKGEVGAPLNRFKSSSKIFYWPFQGGTSFVDLFFLSCVCYAFVSVCLYVPCGHLLWKGWPIGSRLWCLTVSLLLSHWYPGSGVVLDCIYSWSLHPTLTKFLHKIANIFLPITLNIPKKNRLIEMVLLSTSNICFNWEVRNFIFGYALLAKGLLTWNGW